MSTFEVIRDELNLRADTNRAAVLEYLVKHAGEKIRIDKLSKAVFGDAEAVNSTTFSVDMLAKRIDSLKLNRKYCLEWIDENLNWFVVWSAK
jgi:DNA-binding winged helix-turn-helix (wHTH) protein